MGSLWVTPVLGGLLGLAAGALAVELEAEVPLPPAWQYSAATASTVLATIVGAEVALTGFVITVTVLVVQMAAGMFSARYMRVWYRDRMLKALLAVLVATTTLAFTLLRRVEDGFVPNLGITIAGSLVVLGLLLFLVFLDRVVHRLRPVAVVTLVAEKGRAAARDDASLESTDDWTPFADVASVVVRAPRGGAIQAIDRRGIVRWAHRQGCVVVLPHAVGDYVPGGAVLAHAFGGDPAPDPAAKELRGLVALGIERTIDQDPAFAIRIMVDIAAKALSPAVNDPTTAVQVLNHLGDTLRALGEDDLPGRRAYVGPDGSVRLVVPARRWEEYLALAVTEIREYGADSIQVVRRLRAVLEDLAATARAEHRPAVEAELVRLEATVAATFGDTVDLDRAGIADPQGIGGSSRVIPAG